MPSISQQPITVQQMPPPVVAGEPTEQQISQAVRDHVAKNRENRRAAALVTPLNKQKIAIEMAIGLIVSNLAFTSERLQAEACKEDADEEGVFYALNLVDICRRDALAMAKKSYADYNAFAQDFTMLDSLARAVNTVYKGQEPVARRSIESLIANGAAMFEMVELAGSAA